MDLRYAGPDNFVGRPLYEMDCAWVHREAAEGLRSAVQWLRQHSALHQLVVLDALRPHRVQQALWDHLDGSELRRYLADPARGSIHSFGLAIDATLLDARGKEIDMGTPFDDMSELSHPDLESRHLAEGRLRPHQIAHRRLLRDAMAAGGFRGIAHEWWHFDMLDRDHVRRHYARVD